MRKFRLKILMICIIILLPCIYSAVILTVNLDVAENETLLKENEDKPLVSDVYYEPTPGGYCQGIEVDGDIAYLACGGTGVATINISNPINPSTPFFHSLMGWAYDLDVDGDYVYVASGNMGLRIMSCSSPMSVWSSTYRDTSGNAYDVHVSGNYAYIADGSSGLAVINITTPFSPGATVYYEDTAGTAQNVFVRGDYAYIADYDGGFAVIDISDPTNPGTPVTESTNGNALGVYIEGDYAYLATSTGLNVINVTDPTNPDYITMIATGYSSGVNIDGDYAYVGVGIEGLAIVNITDPLNPTDLVKVDTNGFAIDVQVWGNYAFVADNSSLAIVDASSNLITPEVVAYSTTSHNAVDIDIEGNYAYLACLDAGLAVIDISDPENPGTPVYGTCLGSVLGVDVVGDYAFCAAFDEYLVIFDVSDPTNPLKVMNQSTTDECREIDVVGNYAFLACDNNGLAIIDISNPLSPGTAVYKSLGYTTDVEVQGNYAYTLGTYLSATDISDPTSPGTYDIESGTGAAIGLDVSGNFVFMAAGDAGLNVFDIADPTTIGSPYAEDTIGYGRGVWISGDTAYIADNYDGGLARMSVTNPRDPSPPTYTHVDTRAYDVQVHGNYAFLSVGEHSIPERGLCVVEVRKRADYYNPVIISSPSDFSVEYGYTGESISWTATDQNNGTYEIELQGSGLVVWNENWTDGVAVIYNIPDGFGIGDYTYTINFTDAHGYWTTDSVVFSVGPPSTPTAILSPPNATIEVGYSSYELEWNILDDNPDTYTLNRFDLPLPVVDDTPWTSGSVISYYLPLGLSAGTYNYVLIALDDDSNFYWDEVEITIVDNLAPLITQYSANLTVERGYSDLTYTWTATDSEPNTYTIDLIGTGNLIPPTAWSSGTQVEFDIPNGLGVGYHQFMINFTDDSDNWTNHSIWLVVGPDETNPVFTELPNDLTVEEGYTTAEFTWTATDGTAHTYIIERDGTIVAGPNTFTSGVSVTYNIPVGLPPGVYTYTITFNDDYGNTNSDSVTLTVTDEPTPKIPFGYSFLIISSLSIMGILVETIHKIRRKED